jgi:hypothetical protein
MKTLRWVILVLCLGLIILNIVFLNIQGILGWAASAILTSSAIYKEIVLRKEADKLGNAIFSQLNYMVQSIIDSAKKDEETKETLKQP